MSLSFLWISELFGELMGESMFLGWFSLFMELSVRVLEESYLRGSRVDTVSTLVLMLSRRWELEEENWCLKCSIYSQ